MARFPLRQSSVLELAETEAKLTDQPRHTDLEYRVIAINKAGQGEPSNTIAVVL